MTQQEWEREHIKNFLFRNFKSHAAQNIQAFITNIAFPTSLDEVEFFMASEEGQYNVEDVLGAEQDKGFLGGWTAPAWAKRDDICFFMHSKTAIQKIRPLETEIRTNKALYSEAEIENFTHWLNWGRTLYSKYGGKIFAIGRVENDTIRDDEAVSTDLPALHWKSRIYADIADVFILENPIDISEFRDFLLVSRGGTITPVFGEAFEQLKTLVVSKNLVPDYFKNAHSVPVPLKEVTEENWLEIAGDYRFSFLNEMQFRSFYVDFLLKAIADKGKIWPECRCRKDTDCFVDDIILLNGKYLPVEVKLNINNEARIENQCAQYTDTVQMWFSAKMDSPVDMSRVICNRVLVVDTYAVYLYVSEANELIPIADLDLLRNHTDVEVLRNAILAGCGTDLSKNTSYTMLI